MSTKAFGHKRFRLWPPGAHFAMHVWPDAHPRARKSRLADLDAAVAAGALPPPALDLVLGPGDALFVPAFWFHHVTVVGRPDRHFPPQQQQEQVGEYIAQGKGEHGTGVCGGEGDMPHTSPADGGGLSVSLNVFSRARVTEVAGRVLGAPPPPLSDAPAPSPTATARSNARGGAARGGAARGDGRAARPDEARLESFTVGAAALSRELGLGSALPKLVLQSRYRAPPTGADARGEAAADATAHVPRAGTTGGEEASGAGSEGGAAGASAARAEALAAWAAGAAAELTGGLGRALGRREREQAGGAAPCEAAATSTAPREASWEASKAAYVSGVVGICGAHLLEAFALRSFGASHVQHALEHAAAHAGGTAARDGTWHGGGGQGRPEK